MGTTIHAQHMGIHTTHPCPVKANQAPMKKIKGDKYLKAFMFCQISCSSTFAAVLSRQAT